MSYQSRYKGVCYCSSITEIPTPLSMTVFMAERATDSKPEQFGIIVALERRVMAYEIALNQWSWTLPAIFPIICVHEAESGLRPAVLPFCCPCAFVPMTYRDESSSM